MSSLPSEVLEDVLQPLDRWTLDDVQFTNRRLLQLIMERMSDVCLRQLYTASFSAPEKNWETDGSFYCIQVLGRPDRSPTKRHMDGGQLFSEFVQALRSSRVAHLDIDQLVFTPAHAALVLQVPIVADELRFVESSCDGLTAAQFRKIVLHVSPTSLDLDTCRLRACQINDEFLRALFNGRVLCMAFPTVEPVGGGSFAVTDDAVVEFCLQPDVPSEEGDAASEIAIDELTLQNGRFTQDLFKRLVEASRASTRTRPLRIVVSPVHVKDKDLRDFAQHHLYHQNSRLRIYDFRDAQHEADDAMRLQIVLDHRDNTLELNRAQSPNRFFHKSNE
ncbi:hypothetical protein AAVH_24594 [Aphelenchoides avenae]|nr:hypothetical protein AAVH_24594 [Aphelenchus avenae]